MMAAATKNSDVTASQRESTFRSYWLGSVVVVVVLVLRSSADVVVVAVLGIVGHIKPSNENVAKIGLWNSPCAHGGGGSSNIVVDWNAPAFVITRSKAYIYPGGLRQQLSNKVELVEVDALGTSNLSIKLVEVESLGLLVSAIKMTEQTPVLRTTDWIASVSWEKSLP